MTPFAAQLSALDYGVVGVYLVLLVASGLWFRQYAKGGAEGYFLGGRGLPGWMVGLSGAASYFDVSGTMVIISWIFMLGLSGYWCLMSGHTMLMFAIAAVLLGKWIRRSGAVTSNEYMELRFGRSHAGRMSRSISTVGQLVANIAGISYFVIGTGKFFGPYLPWDLPSDSSVILGGATAPFFSRELVACLILVGIGLAYSLVSGYAGVVGADVVQIGVMVLSFSIVVVIAAVHTSAANLEGIGVLQPTWFGVMPPWKFDTLKYAGRYNGFDAMAVVCGFFIVKSVLQGFGALQGHTAQRWLSCRTEKDAGVMSVVWVATMMVRWALVISVVLLGWALVQKQGSSQLGELLLRDPEQIFPYVLDAYLPSGVLGMVMVGLLAAALSTLVSFLNAGASFLVRDVYQEWIRPQAGAREVTYASYVSVLLLVVVSVAISKSFKNINDIWTWMMAAWVGAKFVPLTFFWYWHRANGVGFTLASASGLIAAVLQRWFLPDASPMAQFAISGLPSAVAFVLGSLLTRPVDQEVLVNFYRKIRPWGWWAPIRRRFADESLAAIEAEHKRDRWSVLLAVPWLGVVFLWPMLLMVRQWFWLTVVSAILIVFGWGLYRVWFRWLDADTGEPALKGDEGGSGP